MRKIKVALITQAVKKMCIKANIEASPDLVCALKKNKLKEKTELGKEIFDDMLFNVALAKKKQLPICQDTGMAVVFCEIGQEVHFVGGDFNEAINQGVKEGYREGYLRKSVVIDPLKRNNSGDNTPAVVHIKIVSGSSLKIKVAPKGFGSENMSAIAMLKPTATKEDIIQFVVDTVQKGGANFCPPIVVGIGIGGTFEKAALLSKEALLRPIAQKNRKKSWRNLEDQILEKINKLGIGPQGLGGNVTALAVSILDYPTHIAGLPVAVNICCHVHRHEEIIL